jgi:predicted ATPase/DNA-binding SARP family transcriptional activator
MPLPWRIELLGWLRVVEGDAATVGERLPRTISRFQTQKTGSLLAYLAYHCHRSHPREALIELLWPEDPLAAGRNKLRMALSSLRRQLEPPGIPAGAVIAADRAAVQLNPAACTTDAAALEAALQSASQTNRTAERVQFLERAAALYRGELLPGQYEAWIVPERQRLAEAYQQALGELASLAEQAGDITAAHRWARRAVAADPLREEAHHTLIRLLAAAGEQAAAHHQFQELERLLARELGADPAPATRALVRGFEAREPLTGDPARAASTLVITHSVTPPPPHSLLASALPTGTVAFLLAETVERKREAGESPVEDRQSVLRSLFRGYGGHEVRLAGETLLFAFGRASDALAAAVAAQKAAGSGQWGAGSEGTLRTEASSDLLSTGPPATLWATAHCPLPTAHSLRMALHLGEVEPGEGAECSSAMPRVTRLLLAAHPGQILLSEETSGLLRHDLAPDLQIEDLGLYRLRDQAAPERLFQVRYAGMAPGVFPPPAAPPGSRSHLPLQFTRFIGRECEIGGLEGLLQPEEPTGDSPQARAVPELLPSPAPQVPACRLVTLTGPGGSGKTRLALEVAARLREAYGGAVWLVPLADVTEPRLMIDKALDALQLSRSSHLQPLEQVVAILSGQPSLLLLDNFEHLLGEGATLVQTLLQRAPSLRLVVTSRQRLDLAGEREFPLSPLGTPTPSPRAAPAGILAPEEQGDEWASAPEELLACESVMLFVDRAQAVRPDFQVTRANAGTVAALCRRLEGIPLALELAAARAGVMTPAQMLARLDQRFELLVSRHRDVAPRHRSLRAALEWSDQLLSSELRRFFRQLSVFRGGWTLEAAEAVCAGSEGQRAEGRGHPDAIPVLDFLEQLRECSLVQAEEETEETRFRMLETVREYAGEQLDRAEQTELSRRHAAYYLALAEHAQPYLKGPEQGMWLERLEREHDNLRAVLAWAVASREADTGLRLGGTLWWFWSLRGYLTEGRERLAELLAVGQANTEQELGLPDRAICQPVAGSPRSRAKAQACAGFLAQWQGDYAAARALFEQSLAIQRELGDPASIAFSLTGLGQVTLALGDPDRARFLCDEAMPIWQELQDQAGIAWSLNILGNAAAAQGDQKAARALLEEGLARWRQTGDRWGIAWSLNELGNMLLAQKEYAAARSLYESSLAIKRELGDKAGLAWSFDNLGRVACHQGDFGAARRHYRECLTLRKELGDRRGMAACLDGLAEVAAAEALGPGEGLRDPASMAPEEQRARAERAVRLLGAAASLRAAFHPCLVATSPADPGEPSTPLRCLLGEAAFAAAWETGQAMTGEEAAALGLDDQQKHS